jgi:S-(hydroxymethyl)glutathione dehydrogenase/alcohol dehydrogenase
MKVRAAVCVGVGEPWKVEEIDVDGPSQDEVEVEMAYAGMCHSDEHMRDGTLSAPKEILEQFMDVSSIFPLVGGHEGSGVVTKVGNAVPGLTVGDHVALSFVPACGTCVWCASGRQNLCDLGATTLAGPMISDREWRYHLGGAKLNRMAQLGTFSERLVCHHNSVVKVPSTSSLRAAALISCGIATGFGAAANRGRVQPGDVVVVVGCGGVGSGAIQGAVHAGARCVVAVDPVAFKRQSARTIGATHDVGSMDDAAGLVSELTEGRMADVVVLTPSVLKGDLVAPAVYLASKDGRIVCVSAAPWDQTQVSLDLVNLVMFNKALLGTVFGSVSPRVQIPNLLRLYESRKLHVDELVTREYSLDETQNGYDDMLAGSNIRGVINFGR